MASAEALHPSHSLGEDLLSDSHGLDTKSTAKVTAAAVAPPTHSTRTIPELMAIRAREQPSAPILGYPSSGTEYIEYTFGQLQQFSDAAANVLAKTLPVRTSSSEKAKVVALLGPSTVEYVIAILALSKLGFTVLFLSPRLAVPAYEHLLEVTGCQHVVVGEAMTKITDELKVWNPSLTVTGFVPQPVYEEPQPWTPPTLNLDEETNQTAWIIHSSGSTGPPKPIYQTHHAALRNCENNMNMEGFITLPLYHGHGVSCIFRAFTSSKKIYMMNAALPLTTLTLVQIMSQYKFEIFYGVPYALKLLAESEQGIKALAEMQVVMFGGSACPDALGDLLVDNGVNLISHYGCTETGQLMTSFRTIGDKVWNYVRVHDRLRPYVKFERQGDSELFELIVAQGWPSKVDTNREDGSYATKDLFMPHPTLEEAWKYVSRRDDTIILVNGEKMIPIAMEQAVRQHPLAKEAIVFGTGRSQTGVLVFASENAVDLPHETIIDTLWPTVVEQNAALPNYAQVDRGMITVLPPNTDFPHTAKDTIIRQAAYQAFQEVIEGTYQRFENQNGGSLVLDLPAMKTYLRGKMHEMFKLDEAVLTDDVDLFVLGVDSLQSTLLRGKILKDVDLNGSSLPQNVVFEFPTISRLANALVSVRENRELNREDVTEQMEFLVKKYSQWAPHDGQQMAKDPSAAAVVVTGATGSLGAHLVAQLANTPSVGFVHCLVRAPSNDVAMQRVVNSMRRRRVYNSLSPAARSKLCYHASDLASAQLGLSDAVYASICNNVVSVMHCAWSVNFNKHLSSFEDCIIGVQNLISLCLGARLPKPATFNFCSSVSTVSQITGTVPTAVPSFDKAHRMGYAQSKLVSEHIVQRAVQDVGVKARVIRVGQITSDTANGIWNETEAIPLLLSTVRTLGILPALDETHRWLPVDIVAKTFADISLSDSVDMVFNLANHSAFHWTDELLPKLREAGLEFEQVEREEWLKQLRDSDPDPAINPTIKLLDFYEAKYGEGSKKMRRAALYDTGNAEFISSSLRDAVALEPGLINKMVNNFLRPWWASQGNVQQDVTSLIVVSGAGTSKATVSGELVGKLKGCWIDGNALHDSERDPTMSSGEKQSSLDEMLWLAATKLRILGTVRISRLLGVNRPIVLTCSALRSHSRSALRDVLGDGSMKTWFVELEPVGVASTLAVPLSTEEEDVIPISMGDMTSMQLADLVLSIV